MKLGGGGVGVWADLWLASLKLTTCVTQTQTPQKQRIHANVTTTATEVKGQLR